MNRSFFHYLMTLRGGGTHDALSVFATEAGKDIQFPKHSSSYEEISNYLELNVDYCHPWISLTKHGKNI